MKELHLSAALRFSLRIATLFLVSAVAGQVSASRSLREAARHSGILIGTAVRPYCLKEESYASTLAREFNMLEPEDALKWEVLRPDPQSFDFSQADQVVEFAIRNSMKIRGHTLLWHRQNPAWLAAGNYSPQQLSALLENHIKTVVGHYRGKIFAWDVANEAFDEGKNAGKLRGTIWYDQPGIGFAEQGTAYLAQCFRWAHEADPQALLFYNEAEAEEMNAKSDAIYAMVRAFKRDGIPIDGVGFQMHINNLRANIASIEENIARFAALGIQVHITEMDVALPVDSTGNPTAADLQAQAEIYRRIAQACLSHASLSPSSPSHAGCTAIQTWGFTDKYSWIGSHSKHKQGAALQFDRNYHPKPAYEAIIQVLSRDR